MDSVTMTASVSGGTCNVTLNYEVTPYDGYISVYLKNITTSTTFDIVTGHVYYTYSGGSGHKVIPAVNGRSVDVRETYKVQKSTSESSTSIELESNSWVTFKKGSTESHGSFSSASKSITVPALAQYTLSYSLNGGSGSISSQRFSYGKPIHITTTVPTKENYAFLYWCENSNGTGDTYDPGDSFWGYSNTTLYAIWKAPVYVNYYANGGTNAPSRQAKIYQKNLTLTTSKPSRDSYVFKRWNTNTTDTGTSYNPGDTYTEDVALSLYAIWNPTIIYDANGGSGAPAKQTKVYGEAITLQTGIPTRSGYSFVSWNTSSTGSGTSVSPGSSYTDNTSVILYAIWLEGTKPPTIYSLSVIRCDSHGQVSDEGTYCRVTVSWAIDKSLDHSNTGLVTGTINPEGGSSRTFTYGDGYSGVSNVAVATVPGCDTDTQYLITVRVTDSYTYTQRTAILTRASYILDLKNGGKALGIGSAAPRNEGLEIGWATQFDKNVSMLLNLSVTGNLSVEGILSASNFTIVSYDSGIATASGGWSLVTQVARKYGKLMSVCIGFQPTSDLAAGVLKTICTINSGFRPIIQHGFSDSNGIGYIGTNGSTKYRTLVAVTSTTTVYVEAIYMIS